MARFKMKSTILEKQVNKIYKRSLRIAVLGSGYVGLPTAALFAQAGFQVVVIDIKPEVVEAVNSGVSHIKEPGLNEIISHNIQAGRLKATTSSEAITQADAIIVSVQTPIDQDKEPNLSFLMKVLEDVERALKEGMLVIISSTVPPGTITEQIKPQLELKSGLIADFDFYLAYVPERIAPGNALKEFVESPRLAGGIGSNSTKIAAELFRTVSKTVIETDASTAEIAKLSENTFRDVNIAFANQLALICEKHGVDVTKVIELANTHPRVKIHKPGPGVGGPCLTKDPYLLIHKTNLESPNLIETARKVNDYMPDHIIKLTLKALEEVGKKPKDSIISVLGTAYKADIDDSRDSPSKPIIQKLLCQGVKVKAYDPHCNKTFGAEKTINLEEAAKGADCLMILTEHTAFKNLNLEKIKKLMNSKPVIIDGRRIIDPHKAKEKKFIYYGI